MRAFFRSARRAPLFILSLAPGVACAPSAAPPSSPVSPRLAPAAFAAAPGSPQEQERALRPIENAACVIRTENVALVEPLPLSYGGKEFATVQHARRLELRAAGSAPATLEVSTENFTAIGEVHLEDVLVGPRTRSATPHDGWLSVYRARVKAVSNDALSVDVTLPTFVTPAAPLAITYPCNELTFQPDVEPASYEFRYLKRGAKIPLRLTPRGQVVAWLESSPNEPAEQVAELERKGRAVRIAIPDADVTVQGWVDASALSSKWAPSSDLIGALNGDPISKASARAAVQCSADIAFYVRADDSTSPMRVGTLRGSSVIHHGPANQRGEVPIDLGLDAASLPPPLQPFIRASAIAGCIEAPGR